MTLRKTTYCVVLGLKAAFLGAVSQPVAIQRACLDNVTLTVSFRPANDPCGSFVSYRLYGRDNSANPFVLLKESNTLTDNQIQTILPNKKRWELYVTTRFACNGTDTLNSDTILIDDQAPAYLEPDSVSIDWSSQRMIAGWPKALEPDVMGYSLFKSDPSTGNNVLIDKTSQLNYDFTTLTFDPMGGGNRYCMAAFDSCNNGGPISSFHSPVLLSFNTGQNVAYQCTRKLYLQWTAYVGYTTAQHEIWVFNSNTSTWNMDGTTTGAQLSYVFNIPTLGANYTFIIRAKKQGSSISSSSNKIVFNTLNFTAPLSKNISRVSVIGDGEIQVKAFWSAGSSAQQVRLQRRAYLGTNWVSLATFSSPITDIYYNDKNLETSTLRYQYRLIYLNACGEIFDSSDIHTSILLRRNFYNLYWNGYWAWANTSHSLQADEREKQSSTWNSGVSGPDSLLILTDTTKAVCYRIVAYRIGINGKYIDTSYSNEVCLQAFDTTLIPSGFTPGGINSQFKIINVNILPGQSTMRIYDRWGAKLFEGDALIGWDGKDQNDVYLGPGIYPYTIQIVRPEKRDLLKGTVVLIR
ncbi:MAG: gliding motility-associated C-terminal domain-containing protein [Bacteroidia bacterium]